MVPFYGESPNTRSKAYREYASLVSNLQVGGLIILNRVQNGTAIKADPYAMAVFLNRMQRLAKTPLIVGGDFERGASMRMNGTPQYPHAMAFGAAGNGTVASVWPLQPPPRISSSPSGDFAGSKVRAGSSWANWK